MRSWGNAEHPLSHPAPVAAVGLNVTENLGHRLIVVQLGIFAFPLVQLAVPGQPEDAVVADAVQGGCGDIRQIFPDALGGAIVCLGSCQHLQGLGDLMKGRVAADGIDQGNHHKQNHR